MISSEEEKEFKQRLADLKSQENIVRNDIGNKKISENGADPQRAKWTRYTMLGFEFIAIFLGFMFLGKFTDDKLQSTPIFIFIGASFGFGLALYRLIKIANQLSGEGENPVQK